MDRLTAASGSFDDEVDWTLYEPPEALGKLPNITSETIIAVVQSSLENIKNQIQVEKQRCDEATAALQKEADEQKAVIGAAALAAQFNIELATTGKGKEKALYSVEHPDPRVPSAVEIAALQAAPSIPRQKPQKRSRFGISRILRHVRGESSESKNNHTIALTTRLDSGGGSGPSPFTQFIYKHLKPSVESVGDTIECVSCLDDIPKSTSIKTICHHYCSPCFSRLIETAIGNETQWPPKCCLSPIPFRTISKHVPSSLLASYRAKDGEFKVPVESRIYCPVPDCGVFIPKEMVDQATKTARCPAGHGMCVMCRGDEHAGTGNGGDCPSDRDRELADKLAEEEGWKRCGKCRVLVEHKDACQHMTCRCGAQFCYVCGLVWRTCACTMEQLAEIKARAEEKRLARTAVEEAEARELKEALKKIEEFEREEARKEQLRRVEEERKREERRRAAELERKKREEARRRELDAKYEELRDTLGKLEELQRMVLTYSHDRKVADSAEAADARMRQVNHEQQEERRALKLATAEKLEQREQELETEYWARMVWEKKLEEGYEETHRIFWSDKVGGAEMAKRIVDAYLRRNDQRMDLWWEWRDRELEETKYLLEDEATIREELMEASIRKLKEERAEEVAELSRRQRAETIWFDLVIAERKRLLAEVEAVERESGGDETSPSPGRSSEEGQQGWGFDAVDWRASYYLPEDISYSEPSGVADDNVWGWVGSGSSSRAVNPMVATVGGRDSYITQF